MSLDHRCTEPTAIHTQLAAIFVSLELSRKTWLVTSVSPQSGSKMSRHSVAGGDMAGLLARFEDLRSKARAQAGKVYPIIVIQEAGLDGFWIHRVLEAEGIESHVVDAASIATSRRRRRVKTDKIDGEALVRSLLAYKRGEPRVCSMVRPLTPEDEDRRRVSREYKALITEGMDVGLATVYRVLTQFEQAGLLARQHFETGKAVFELNQGGHHDHLVCLQCGRVEEFYDGEIEKRQSEIAGKKGFELRGHSLALYADCTKANCPHRQAARPA